MMKRLYESWPIGLSVGLLVSLCSLAMIGIADTNPRLGAAICFLFAGIGTMGVAAIFRAKAKGDDT